MHLECSQAAGSSDCLANSDVLILWVQCGSYSLTQQIAADSAHKSPWRMVRPSPPMRDDGVAAQDGPPLENSPSRRTLYFLGGLIMMCAPAVPGFISHGAPSLALVDSPVDWGVANGT